MAWVNMSTRRQSGGSSIYAPSNQALNSAAARWTELVVLDWNSVSDDRAQDRWYSDDVHLTTTGQAEFGHWLRNQILSLTTTGGVGGGSGGSGGSSSTKVQPGVPLRFSLLGSGGVPESGVRAVSLNVTAVDPDADGYLTVWACGSARPETSNVNYAAGAVEPNAVVVPVDETGEVCVSTYAASHVLVDVMGWYSSGFERVTPSRQIDTRVSRSKVQPGVPLRFSLLGSGGVPESGVRAVSLNVTAVDPDADGYLTVWACGSARPETSNVNYAAGAVEPNAVVVPVDETGEVCVSTYAASHVLVDVMGWYSSGFERVTPSRQIDTRVSRSKVQPGVPLRFSLLGSGGVPESGVRAVSLNVTAVDPDADGYLTVWACGSARPETSNVNYAAGAVEPNAVVVPVDETGEVCVSTYAASHVLVDVMGWYSSAFEAVTPSRPIDSRSAPVPR